MAVWIHVCLGRERLTMPIDFRKSPNHIVVPHLTNLAIPVCPHADHAGLNIARPDHAYDWNFVHFRVPDRLSKLLACHLHCVSLVTCGQKQQQSIGIHAASCDRMTLQHHVIARACSWKLARACTACGRRRGRSLTTTIGPAGRAGPHEMCGQPR